MSEEAPLLPVCSLPNRCNAQYLIVGARACWLHGYVRATADVDILIPEDFENTRALLQRYLETVTRSKSTQREQDKVDIQRVRSLTTDS